MEKVQAHAALKREEQYLREVIMGVERQLAVLKAEQVELQRQIVHHEQHAPSGTSSGTPVGGGGHKRPLSSDDEEMPILRLDMDSTDRNSDQVSEVETDSD